VDVAGDDQAGDHAGEEAAAGVGEGLASRRAKAESRC